MVKERKKLVTHCLFHLILTQGYVLLSFKEKGNVEGKNVEGRGRETSMWDETLPGYLPYVPQPGTEPIAQLRVLIGTEAAVLWRTGQCSNQPRYLARAIIHSGVSYLLAYLCHTGRRVVLDHTLNTLWHVITHTKKSHNVLSEFTILCWATFTAILDCTQPTGHSLGTPVDEK